MAKHHELAKKLGYEIKKDGKFYWFYAKQFSPACMNFSEKVRINGPFSSKAQAAEAAVVRYWDLAHKDPNMQRLVWTRN